MSLVSPALALGFVLAMGYAAAFNLWQRGDLRTLLRYLLASWLGFGLGHWLGAWLGLDWLMVGRLRIFMCTLGALLALFAARLGLAMRQ